MSKIFCIIFISIILKIIRTNPEDEPPSLLKEEYPNITCGKKNPKKPKDCIKYGTYTGMLCCWVTSGENETNNAECTLLSKRMADLKGISGSRLFIGNFDKRYWVCRNNSIYLNINFILYFMVYCLLFFM